MKRGLFAVLVLLVASAFAPAGADAAILKRVHNGETALTTGTAVNIPLDLPDHTKAFVVCTVRTTVNKSTQRVTCVLTNNNLEIDGGASLAASTTVSWFVAEFETGVTVQRNTSATALAATTTATVGVSITSVNCDRSFVLLGTQTDDATNNATLDERFTLRAYLQDQTTQGVVCGSGASTNVLRLDRNETGTNLKYAYQVVTMDTATVQRNLTTINAAATSATGTITCVDPAKTFALVNFMASAASGGLQSQSMTTPTLTNVGCTGLNQDRITLTRGSSTNSVDTSWEVVTVSDATVAAGSASDTGTSVTSAAFTAVNLGSSIPFATTQGTLNTLALQPHTAEFQDTTHLLFTRGASSATATTVQFYVVSFFRCNDDPLCAVGGSTKAGEVRVIPTAYIDTSAWSTTKGCPRPGCANVILRNTNAISEAPVNGTQYATGAVLGVQSPQTTVVYAGYQTVTTATNAAGATAVTVSSTTGFPSSCTDGPPLCRAVIYDVNTGDADEFTYGSLTATKLQTIPTTGYNALAAHGTVGSVIRVFKASETVGSGTVVIPLVITNSNTTAGAATISVASDPAAAGFPAVGTAYIAGYKSFQYGGLTSNSFTGVTGIDRTYTSGASIISSLTGMRDTGLTNGTAYNYKVFPKTGPSTYVTLTGSIGSVSATPLAGNTQWTFQQSGGSALNAPIPVGNGQIYISTNGAKILGMSENDGNLLTSADTLSGAQAYVTPYPESATGTDVVVGADNNGTVYSIDALSGTLRWATQLPNLVAQDAVVAGLSVQLGAFSGSDSFGGNFTSQYSTDLVFVGTYSKDGSNTWDHRVVALRGDTGAIVWTFRPNAGGLDPNLFGANGNEMDQVVGQPWVDYGQNWLYVSTKNGQFGGQNSLYKIRTVTQGANAAGTLVSATSVPGDLPYPPTMSLDGSRMYVGSADTQSLRAFDLTVTTWTEPWSGGFTFGGSGHTPKGYVWEDFRNVGPQGQRRLYIVTNEGTGRDAVWCVQDNGGNGASCWARQHPSATGRFGQPTLAADGLYVPSNNGKIYKLSYTDGTIVSCFAIAGSPSLGDATSESGVNALYVGSTAGSIYRVNLPIPTIDPVANCNP